VWRRSRMSGGASTDDRERKILRDRAKMLAIVPEAAPEDGVVAHVLRFSLGAESYAVETRHIREVLPLPRVVPLPCVPSFIRGIINIRGRIVCLLDLKSILGLPETTVSPTPSVIILQSPGREFSLLADEISGLDEIPLSSIQASLPTLTDVRAQYLKGVTASGLVLLDAEKLLSDKKLVVDESIGRTV
jgi:purine-binding chemotaxis protein CheW